MHTAAIGQIRTDLSRRRVITLSSDRTVRIWQLPSLRLIRVLRLPQEGSLEGLPLGLAISPDGQTTAVGGWTGMTWEKTASIYFYNTVSGEMTRRAGGFEDLISSLDWSPDGKFLAVGLAGQHGIRVLDASSGKVVASDTEYQDSVSFLHFSSNGLLAVSAADGSVRLYDSEHRLTSRQQVGVSRLLGGIRFSPDGKLLALGIIDKPLALVLKVPNLELATLRQISDPQQKGLCCVAWSRDGKDLFVNGEHLGTGATPLYRLGNAGVGAPQVLPVGNQRFANMVPLPDGGLLFATTTPSLTLLDADGKVVRSVNTVIGDFRDGQKSLLVSADGLELSVPMDRFGQKARRFVVDDQDRSPIEANLMVPVTSDSRFVIEGLSVAGVSALGSDVTVNGKRLDIHIGDQVTAHALAHDGNGLFVGTNWGLLRLNKAGGVVWRQNFSGEVRAVNATANNLFVVIALSDGTARWLRQADGVEVLAYFPHNNGRDWVAWRPDGYYASSEEGDQFVGWHVNRGLDEAPDFYRAVQFERVFYRPDLVHVALDPLRTAKNKSVEPELVSELRSIAPARLSILETSMAVNGRGRVEIIVKVDALARILPMQQLAVYVNGIPVTPTVQRALVGGDQRRFTRTLTVESDRPDNDIRIEVDHGRSLGLVETYAELSRALPRQKSERGRLFLVAIGINEFTNVPDRRKRRLPDLEFAAQDSREILKAMQGPSKGIFTDVKAVALNDFTETKPDKAEIRKALATFDEAGPDDTVILFLASHGFSDKAGNYFFMPRDGIYEDVVGAVKADNAAGSAKSLIEGDEFFDALRKTAGRRILIVDTCHARNIEGLLDTHTLKKRSAASSFAFMVAANGNESSQEYEEGGQGLFTYALLQSLSKAADADGDGVISLAEAFQYLAPLVEKLHDPKAGSQSPQLTASSFLKAQPLASAMVVSR